MATALKAVPKTKEVKLDLGCGQNVKEGFLGVDLYAPGAKRVDLMRFPWPFKSDSVDEIHCSHFLEHVPGKLRGRFMDEVWRILKPDCKITVMVPYGHSNRATQDFTHEWPPITEESFLYFYKAWREQNKLTHGPYDLKCDFDFGSGYTINAAFQGRTSEFLQNAIRTMNNVADDLMVTLTKRVR